jgi:excisionase family DNA binding protein
MPLAKSAHTSKRVAPTSAPLAPLDVLQRYTIPEAADYLRCSRAWVYILLERGELRTIRDGRRVYVPGSEIARRSQAPGSTTKETLANF